MDESEKEKTGHKEIISETLAKIKFFQQGINAYSRFLDVDRVDFVLRIKKKDKIEYKEVQVKLSRQYKEKNDKGEEVLTTWINLVTNKLRVDNNFYYVFICGLNYENFIILPSADLLNILKEYCRVTKNKGQEIYVLCIGNYEKDKWGILIENKEKKGIIKRGLKYNKENFIDITQKYLNNFEQFK